MRWPAPPPLELAGHHVRRATLEDEPAIQRLLELDAAYFELAEGAPPRPTEARTLLTGDLPPELTLDRKHVYAIHHGARLVALIELLERYPDDATWYLGFLYVAPHARGQGVGSRLLDALATHVAAHGATKLRLAVVADNTAARRLYDRRGFAPVAMSRRPRTTWTGAIIWVDVLERALLEP